MRFDIVPGNVWVEINQFKIESEPPILRMLVRAGHAFTDRRSELRLNLMVSAWNSVVGTARVDIFILRGLGRLNRKLWLYSPAILFIR